MSFSTFWQQHPLRQQYVNVFGEDAFRCFADSHFRPWLEQKHPRFSNRSLTESELLGLFSDYSMMGTTPADFVRILVIGEREQRWVVPVVEGVLTTESVATVVAP